MRIFKAKGIEVNLSYYTAKTLPKDLLDRALDVLTRNMSKMYQNCPGWSWNSKKKRRELQHKDSRLIIAVNAVTNNFIGFVHFRFMFEDRLELYL